MNRNSVQLKQENAIFIKGDLQKIRLNHQGHLPKIVFPQLSLSRASKRLVGVNPVKVYSQDKVVAAIDQNSEAWLMTELFEAPVNLSELVKTKILKIYLGEKQLVANTKTGNILINWGTKKLIDQQKLTKINIPASLNIGALFQAFTISDYQSSDFYTYCPEPKTDNYNRLYHFDSTSNKIIGYPTRDILEVNKIIKGVSVGQHHCLCWDQEGNLYSWGNRTLALGYNSLPSDEYVQKPQPVKITKKVITAVAATHYSLALTEEGAIYEWGIKREVNQINDEAIFKPRPLTFRYFRCNAKFVILKGKQNNFAALSSTGQLYVWGLTAKRLISADIQLPQTWKGNYLFEPVLQTQFQGFQIRDFSIDHGYLAVIAGKTEGQTNEYEEYWNILKLKAKKQLQDLKKIRISTQSDEVQTLKKKYKNSILSCSQEKPQKKTLCLDKMKSTVQTSLFPLKNQKNKSQRFLVSHFKRSAPVLSQKDPFWSTSNLRNHKRQASQIPDQIKSQDPQINNYRCSETCTTEQRFGKTELKKHKFSQLYKLRLKEITEKKNYLEQSTASTFMKKIAQDSTEFRLKKKEQHLHRKKALQDEKLLKNTLQKLFVQSYLSTLCRSSADQARFLKIKNFSRNLVLQRVERNIRNLFIAKKVQYSLSNLKQEAADRYIMLHSCVKRYVANFRKRRFLRCRKLVVETIVKNDIMQKVRAKVQKLIEAKGKIKKMNDWLRMYQRQRKQCLKEVWNNFITYTFKVKDGGQYYFNQPDPEMTFQKLYKGKLQRNPMLRLYNYLKFTTPFLSVREIRLSSPPRQNRQRRHRSPGERDRHGHPTQILPFSLHFNYFRRPKNIDVNVGEANRVTPLWIDTERTTLEEHFQNILMTFSRDFALQKRQYEVNLACFIANNYDTFYEKRWKFILEYNKVEKTQKKRKKQSQLRRLLNLIGMTKLIEQDCIPEKHMVLEQALKRKDVPRSLGPIMHFNLQVFEQSFKEYVESLKSKIRMNKKNWV